LDVGITLEDMQYATQPDVIALASGDDDSDMLLERARLKHQVDTKVYGGHGIHILNAIRC
jgi:uncharacterized LabA/DUF88 family protein